MIQNLVPSFAANKSCSILAKANRFFLCFGLWIILLLIPLLLTSKYTSFVEINHFRSYPADLIFTFFTILGNGIILIPLAVLFLIKKRYRTLIGLLVAVLINTLVVSLLKHAFGHLRPLASYGADVVQTAKWVTLHTKYAFPSGHTALAFCLGTYLSLSYRSIKTVPVVCFICAALVGYSRIYLGQHFLEDVWLGSLLGVLVAFVTYKLVQYSTTKIRIQRQNKQNSN